MTNLAYVLVNMIVNINQERVIIVNVFIIAETDGWMQSKTGN